MSTNAGTKVITKTGEVPGVGKVWYDPSGLVNIIALKDAIKKYRVTFDSGVKNTFFVHSKTGVIPFRANADGLYSADMTGVAPNNNNNIVKKHQLLISTV